MADKPSPIHYTSDNHIHTRYCRHASGSMEEYVKSAIQKGLHKICFLEHMEVGINYFERVWLKEEDFDSYFNEGRSLQKKYQNQLSIGLGVEVGYNPHCREELLEKLSKRSWDCIGLSYHFTYAVQQPYHVNMVSRKQANISLFNEIGCDKLLDDYFSTLIEAVDYMPADFLCHLDAALRFQPGLQFSEKNYQKINTLLTKVKKNNMALEINTSGFAIRDEPFPNNKILKMAVNKDIALIAGSDAHRPEDVGRFFDRLPALWAEL